MEKQAQEVKQEPEEETETETENVSDPPTQQCRRADGRGWRCLLPALPQQSMCEKHTRQRLLWEAKKREGFTNSRKGEVSASSRNGNGNIDNNILARKKKLNKSKQREMRNRLQAKKNKKKKLRWPSYLAPLEGISLDLPNGVMVIPPLHGPALAQALQKFGVRK